jgi:hypothetical protein
MNDPTTLTNAEQADATLDDLESRLLALLRRQTDALEHCYEERPGYTGLAYGVARLAEAVAALAGARRARTLPEAP